jgi:hypothetical protein
LQRVSDITLWGVVYQNLAIDFDTGEKGESINSFQEEAYNDFIENKIEKQKIIETVLEKYLHEDRVSNPVDESYAEGYDEPKYKFIPNNLVVQKSGGYALFVDYYRIATYVISPMVGASENLAVVLVPKNATNYPPKDESLIYPPDGCGWREYPLEGEILEQYDYLINSG